MHPAWLAKPVVDWYGAPVGRVREVVLDPRTGAARAVIIDLGPEARRSTSRLQLTVPAREVAVLRRDGVGLHRSLRELMGDASPMPSDGARRLPPA